MQPTAVTPARIDPPAQPLSLLRLLRAVVRNPIESWPRAVYREHLHRSRMPGRDAVFVMYPALIRQALVDEADSFGKGMMARRALEPVLGDAILTATAPGGWQRRAAPRCLAESPGLLPAMIAAAERTRERWLSYPTASEIDVAREMMRTTFDIVLATMLSDRAPAIPPAWSERSPITSNRPHGSWRSPSSARLAGFPIRACARRGAGETISNSS
jgi:hypothetical protein